MRVFARAHMRGDRALPGDGEGKRWTGTKRDRKRERARERQTEAKREQERRPKGR